MRQASYLSARTTSAIPKTPTLRDVMIYFSEKEMPETEARAFYQACQTGLLITRKTKTNANWKKAAHKWIAGLIKSRPWLFNRQVH